MLGKSDFRSLHLRNKDYQRNGFQILSDEITLNKEIWGWTEITMWQSIENIYQIKYGQTKLPITSENKKKVTDGTSSLCLIATLSCICDC